MTLACPVREFVHTATIQRLLRQTVPNLTPQPNYDGEHVTIACKMSRANEEEAAQFSHDGDMNTEYYRMLVTPDTSIQEGDRVVYTNLLGETINFVVVTHVDSSELAVVRKIMLKRYKESE